MTATPTEKRGTFLVTDADADSAVLSDVADGQVHTLTSNPGLTEDDIVEGVLVAEPPLEVMWSLTDIEHRRQLQIVVPDEPPAERTVDLAAGEGVGELVKQPLEGTTEGELHVLSVAPEKTEAAIDDITEDDATRIRAARLGASRVEVRGADGVIGVRYLR
ncbi:MAG: DUF5812 family protein [Halobacteriales archaeon]